MERVRRDAITSHARATEPHLRRRAGTHAISQLQRSAGNQAVIRMLSGRTLQRAWLPDSQSKVLAVKQHRAELSEADVLFRLIDDYDRVPDTETEARIATLVQIREAIVTVVKASGLLDVKADVSTEPGQRKVAFDELGRAITAETNAIRSAADLERYKGQKAATEEAFKTGVPTYLNVSPRPGSNEALAGGRTAAYPESIPGEKQYRLGVPEKPSQDLDIKIEGQGGVIELLVVAGGHGGVGQMFETDTELEYFSREWWERQATLLAKKNVRARLILLDACLTASMVSAFLPLLTPDGRIVGFVHSVPQKMINAHVWEEIHAQDPRAIPEIIQRRMGALMHEHAESRHDVPTFAATISVAVYNASNGYLRYDQQALSDETIPFLPSIDQPEVRNLRGEFAKPHPKMQPPKGMTGYRPNLDAGREQGTEVATAATKKYKRSELPTWYTSSGDEVDDATVKTGDFVRNPNEWTTSLKIVTLTADEFEVVVEDELS